MRLFWHELKAEQKLFWRAIEAAFFTFFLPVIFFLIFAAIYGNDNVEGFRGARFLVAGMIGYGVAATAFAGLAITLVIRRESGVLKRLRSTPLPPATYIAAVLGSTLIVFLLQSLSIIGLGRVFYDAALPTNVVSVALTLLLGAGAFAALGVAMTVLVRSAEGSSAVVNAVYLPMAFISGTFFPSTNAPRFLEVIAEVLPLTYFTRLTRDVMLRGDQIWSHPGPVGVVVAWGAVGLAAALRGFRWEPRFA
jgi:ABC-2 type transport system permease protein